MKKMLAAVRPELTSEWSERNLPLTPDSVTHGSNKIVWWNGKCGHEWRASIKNRVISGSGCPYCSHNAILEGYNDLASQKPELAAEWSAKNAPLLPTQVTVFANRKAWWRCRECGNEWKTLISTRSDGSKCPYCSGYILLKGFNDFATLGHQDISTTMNIYTDATKEMKKQEFESLDSYLKKAVAYIIIWGLQNQII